MNKIFDMLLVVAGVDFKNLDIVILNAKKYISPRFIYVVAPLQNLKEAKQYKNVVFINEDEIIDKSFIKFEKYNLPGFPGRKFWYYQQFLKMAFSCSKYCTGEYYLIWDADTIPLKKMVFFSELDEVYLTLSDNEYHEYYFLNIEKILGENYILAKKSFIAQHMMIKKEHMIDLIKKIGTVENHIWIENIMSKLYGKSMSLFSEYELYATFVMNNFKNNYCIRRLNWFRRGAYLLTDMDSLYKLSKHYDFISIEKSDTSFFKGIYFKILYMIYIYNPFSYRKI